MTKFRGTVLAYTIHNGEPWWRAVGAHLNFEGFKTVSDLRGEGDYCVVDDFYAAYRRHYRERAEQSSLLSRDEVDDVIARCRVLRWLPRRKAAAMALAMADAFDIVLDAVRPVAVVAWPIDRYVSDVLARLALARGIPCYDITASPLLNRTMMLFRGQIVATEEALAEEQVEEARRELADPLFMLPHLVRKRRYGAIKFAKTFSYFKLRAWAFWGISYLKRDPLNLHYVDAQSFLGHKPRLGDVRMLWSMESDWQERFERMPKERRLFLALQLFPEASIDYWISDLGLVQHEDMLVEIAQAFSQAGWAIAVKDHPLQFGFRQMGLIDRLRRIENVTIVPYSVTGNEVLALADATFTCTGTLGMQSAMLGKRAITAEAYFTTPGDFITIRSRAEIAGLPARVAAFEPAGSDEDRQRRIAEKLLRGSFPGDYMTFMGFREHSDPTPLAELGRNFGKRIYELGPDCQDWHGLRGRAAA